MGATGDLYAIHALDTHWIFGRRKIKKALSKNDWEYMGTLRTGFVRKTHFFRVRIGTLVEDAALIEEA